MLRTLTVAELIDLLQGEDPDAQVVFSCNYGDYHRTQQVIGLHGEVEHGTIEESGYSQSGWALARDSRREDEIDEDDEDDDDGEDRPRVLVIR